MTKIGASAGIRAFTLDTSHYRCVLLLSEIYSDLTELSFYWTPRFNIREGTGKWMDLQTGKVREVKEVINYP